jgi:hypothetical protein
MQKNHYPLHAVLNSAQPLFKGEGRVAGNPTPFIESLIIRKLLSRS